MLRVNFVISDDKGSKIFADIFQRYFDSEKMHFSVTNDALPDQDVYHYHRPQMETQLSRPSVVTVHHDLHDPDPFVRFDRFKAIYEQADLIVCLNSGQRAFLADIGRVQTTIIPHGYDQNLFSKKSPRRFDPTRKIQLGVFSKRYDRRFKGEAYFYELLDHLPTDRFAFLFVGEGRLQDALYAEQLGFDCRCFEYLPYPLYPEAYGAVDFLLMVSTFEGGPANLPEAVASGTPILATPVGMAPDLVAPDRNGLLLTRDLQKDLPRFEAIANNTGGLYDALMAGARDLTPSITWDAVIDRHVEEYEQLLKRLQNRA